MKRLALIALLLLPTTQARANDKLTVLLDWFVNPDHAPLLVAQESGAFARAGLDVDLIAPADPNIPPRLVAAGHGDIALTAEPQFHEQIAAGLKLTRIGVLIDRPLATLVSLRAAHISGAADLRGKRIGYGSGEMEKAMVGAILATRGLTLEDVQMVQLGEQLSVALLTGRVDAVTVYRNVESIELRQRGAAIDGIDYEKAGVPPYDELIYAVRRDRAADPRLPRFLRALREATAALRAAPDAAYARAASATADFDNPVNRESWRVTLPYFATDPAALDRRRYADFAAFLARAGVIPVPPDVTAYTTEIR